MKTKFIKLSLCLIGFLFAGLSVTVKGADSQEAVNYLQIQGPIHFKDKDFNLSWSGSTEGKIIQEYLPQGQQSEQYTEMIIVDLWYDADLKDVLSQKVQSIEQRKGNDPVANYQVWENKSTGEINIDLLLSEGNIVEWDIVGFHSFDAGGKKGCYSYSYSRRAYGDDAIPFLKQLKDTRTADLAAFDKMKFPEFKK